MHQERMHERFRGPTRRGVRVRLAGWIGVAVLLVGSAVVFVARRSLRTNAAADAEPTHMSVAVDETFRIDELSNTTAGRAPEDASRRSSVAAPIESKPDAPRQPDVPSPALVRGVRLVALGIDRQPIANRPIDLTAVLSPDVHPSSLELGSAETDSNGHVMIGIDTRAEWATRIFRLRDIQRDAVAWIEPLELPSEGIVDLGQVVLATADEWNPRPLITGWVRDESGAGIGNAFVQASEWSLRVSWGQELEVREPVRPWHGRGIVESDGSFRVYGPDTSQPLSLFVAAPGYEESHEWGLEVPQHGVVVELARRVQLRGILLVPESGPSVTTYGVWLSEAGRGTGVSPDASGVFQALGSSRSIEVAVTQPGLGFELMRERFELSRHADGDLGTIDVRGIVRVLDVVLVDEIGAALAARKVNVDAPAFGGNTVEFHSNDSGRLVVVFPRAVERARLTFDDGRSIEVDLLFPPRELVVR